MSKIDYVFNILSIAVGSVMFAISVMMMCWFAYIGWWEIFMIVIIVATVMFWLTITCLRDLLEELRTKK